METRVVHLEITRSVCLTITCKCIVPAGFVTYLACPGHVLFAENTSSSVVCSSDLPFSVMLHVKLPWSCLWEVSRMVTNVCS